MGELDLYRSAKAIFERCLKSRSSEELLMISDTKQNTRINAVLMTAALDLGLEASMIVMRPRKFPGEEPPKPVASAIKSADCVLSIPIGSITYSKTVQDARKSGVRFLVGTGITENIMSNMVVQGLRDVTNRTRTLANTMNRARRARVHSPVGTDIELEMRPGKTLVIDSMCHERGSMNFLPPGSAHAPPVEGIANGTIVVNGSLIPLGVLSGRIKMTVSEGFVTGIGGGEEAKRFRGFLEGFRDPGVFNLAEVGIGTNPSARLEGIAIEDERIEGGVFFGIGRSLQIGGTVEARTHADAVLLGCTVEFDGRTVVDRGKLLPL